jgi:hypothetical protein
MTLCDFRDRLNQQLQQVDAVSRAPRTVVWFSIGFTIAPRWVMAGPWIGARAQSAENIVTANMMSVLLRSERLGIVTR